VIAILLLLLYSGVVVLGSAITAYSFNDGHDRGFAQFAETPWRGSAVRFYRTNGGVTTDFGVVIRQERALLPGLVLVRNLDLFYPCEARNAVSTDNGIVVTDELYECRDFGESRREYRLKPFLYF
jgi:hypothetical protein